MRRSGMWCWVLLLASACGGKSVTDDNTRSTKKHAPRASDAGSRTLADAGLPQSESEPDAAAPEPSPVQTEPDGPPDVTVRVPAAVEPSLPSAAPGSVEPSAPPPSPVVNPDAGGPLPEPAPEPEPQPEPSTAPLLAYIIGASSNGIRDVRNGSPWFDFEFTVAVVDGAVPWSQDGSMLVDRRGDSLVFFKRTESGFEQGASVPLLSTPKRWLGNDAVLAVAGSMGEEIWLVRPDGSSELVTDALGPMVNSAASADGSQLLFDTSTDGEFSLYLVTLSGGSPSAPVPLGVRAQSPMLSQLWSADGRWLVFGNSGGDGSGIHAYDTLNKSVRLISPEGASYNPLYSFGGGRNVVALYTVTDEPELGVVSLDDDGSWTTVQSGGDTTPADWSRDGTLLLHGASGGGAELVPVGAAGVLGDAIPFPDGSYGCPLYWVSATQFYVRDCTGSDALYRGTVAASGVTRELVTDDALSARVQSPNGNCFVAYSPSALAFGSLAPTYVEAERMQSESPAAFTFTPDSTGVAWGDTTAARFQPLNDACEPAGNPVTLAGSTSTSTIVFLPD